MAEVPDGATDRGALDRWTNEGGAPEDNAWHARRPIADVAGATLPVPAARGLPSGSPRKPFIEIIRDPVD